MSLMSDGKLLASSSDYRGRDPFIDFLVPRDGDYQIRIHDFLYRGGLPYRLLVTDRPYVENVFPRIVQAGHPAALTAFGRNFPEQDSPSQSQINDLPLQQHHVSRDVPGDVLNIGGYQFFEHPSGHSVLPTAATCTLTGIQVQPVIGTDVVSLHAQTTVTITIQNGTRPGK